MNATELEKRCRAVFLNLSDQTKLTLVVTGLVAVGLSIEWFTRMGVPVVDINAPRLLVASRDLERGTILTQLNLTTIGGSHKQAETIFTDQELPIVLGSKLRVPLRRGEPLDHETIELEGRKKGVSDSIPTGLRAYSLKPENDLPVHLRDHIDVLSSPDDSKKTPFPVVSDVEILDLRRTSNGMNLVIAVTEDDLAALEKARQTGKLIIALRSSQEKSGPRRKRRNDALSQKRSLNRSIQVIVEEEK